MIRTIARLRVPFGFIAGAAAFYLARPTPRSILIGGAIAVPGELLRIWASGHLTRWREVTRSGPYKFFPHPLYVGSTIMGVGFAVAAARLAAAVLVALYLAITFTAAVRFESRELTQQFGDTYAAYRDGRATAADRTFSFERVISNREYRAAAGLAIGLALLWVRTLV
jgi:hypothetical protein